VIDGAPTHLLCGVATTCVGRDRELRLLAELYAEARDERVARAALVIGPAGAGKSRVRRELLRRIGRDSIELYVGRGDPMRAGSPFGILAQALRSAIGIADGQAADAQRARIAAHVGRHVPGDAAPRAATFLGELMAVPAPGDDLAVQAARRDPLLMTDLRRRAWLDYLRAATTERPAVIVLEDLHWGDPGTVALIDAALGELRDRPLYVLALARPEVRDLFPALWAGRPLTALTLTELGPRAAEQLVREVVRSATAETVACIVERAAGNAFFLEELIRAAAGGDALPATAPAALQARLEALPAELRRVLRAGSVFGEAFSRGGVAALIGSLADTALAELVARELVYPRAVPTTPGDAAFAFCHGLVRDAAYAMLIDADRKQGHRLAGAWLAAAGEPDQLVLAEHFERGGSPQRAIEASWRAAEQALAGNDLAAAIARAERGVALGAPADLRGPLRLIQAEAQRGRGNLIEAGARAAEAVAVLPRGGAAWFRAVEVVVAASGRRGDYHDATAWARRAAETGAVDAEARSARVTCLSAAARMMYQVGRYDLADELAARVDGDRDHAELEPGALVQVQRLRAARARHHGDVAGDLAAARAVLAACTRCGDLRNACNARVSLGFAHIELGDFAGAERELAAALAEAERAALGAIATRARQNLGLVLAQRGDRAGARALLERVIKESASRGDHRFEGWTRVYLASVALAMGDLAAAASQAQRAIAMFVDTPPARAGALAMLARVRVAQGHTTDAVIAAAAAMAIVERFPGIEEFESLVWLALVEALIASGDRARAAETAGRAMERLAARAGSIADPEVRARFVTTVPENARLGALAEELRV
jgi:tetratricopeptide (TPR) repeat protein